MSLSLNKIQLPGKHHGGNRKVWLAIFSDISAITRSPVEPSVSAITMVADKVFFEIVPVYSSITITDNMVRDDQGIRFDQRLTFDVSKSEIVKELNWLAACRRVVALVEDNNGVIRMIGLPDNPAKLVYSLSKSGPYSGQDRYTVTITAGGTDPSMYFTGTIPYTIVLPTPLIFGSTGDTASVFLQILDYTTSERSDGVQVEYKLSSSSQWSLGPIRPIGGLTAEVTGLTGGTSYDFRCQNLGSGIYSNSEYSAIVTESTT